ncbi:hypothetical protein TrVE_jg13407 [Triparma verrucosa]|uniref:Uncharacterized protein n=1 Tax=Triparma verrucosa TaxID=1606542 RepID=A0A9W7FKJ9_9STRA|nr:hypothetical protein TrVE_jg13407 [Triparma verrucosa]
MLVISRLLLVFYLCYCCNGLSLRLLKPLVRLYSLQTATTEAEVRPEANQLASQLIRHYHHPNRSPLNEERIDNLISDLISSPSAYDPSDLSNSKLYLSLYTVGPKPLWLNNFNVAGQQYSDGSVINYSEVNGPNLYLTASGHYALSSPSLSPPSSCPVDYSVSVTSAEIGVVLNPRLSPLKLNLPIRGTGSLRVLYADRNLRILTTPKETKGTGLPFGLDEYIKWEGEGTTVVQVNEEKVFEDDANGNVYKAGYRL